MAKNICVGTGLVALDIILNDNKKTEPIITAGGSCGNVLTILSFLGWESYPIARLDTTEATQLILEDLEENNVNVSLVSQKENGSAPIIIHRILTDKYGNPKHRFEFRSPKTGKWFPNFKPVLSKMVTELQPNIPKADFFYFDRLSRSSIQLAEINKENGAAIFFEPSSISNEKMFAEALSIADIIKVSDERFPDYKDRFPSSNANLEIITKGSQGLEFRCKGNEWIHLEPIKLEGLVDSAGAGDWSSAGIMKKLCIIGMEIQNLNNEEILGILNYGQKLGALNCLYVGARGLMEYVNKQELDELVEMLEIKPKFNVELIKADTNKTEVKPYKDFLKEYV